MGIAVMLSVMVGFNVGSHASNDKYAPALLRGNSELRDSSQLWEDHEELWPPLGTKWWFTTTPNKSIDPGSWTSDDSSHPLPVSYWNAPGIVIVTVVSDTHLDFVVGPPQYGEYPLKGALLVRHADSDGANGTWSARFAQFIHAGGGSGSW